LCLIALSGFALPAFAQSTNWSAPVELKHEMERYISYSARVQSEHLVLEAKLEPGWKTFTMDNKLRSDEALAGKQSLGVDGPTEIKVSGGLQVAGGWLQLPPKDLSKPEINWYTFGYQGRALFAAKVRRVSALPALIEIRGQACTETTCKNIDIEITLPLDVAKSGAADVDLKPLIAVRTAPARSK
jgi:DsbC/DsbD-like thiol-disulfide interchange protein